MSSNLARPLFFCSESFYDALLAFCQSSTSSHITSLNFRVAACQFVRVVCVDMYRLLVVLVEHCPLRSDYIYCLLSKLFRAKLVDYGNFRLCTVALFILSAFITVYRGTNRLDFTIPTYTGPGTRCSFHNVEILKSG